MVAGDGLVSCASIFRVIQNLKERKIHENPRLAFLKLYRMSSLTNAPSENDLQGVEDLGLAEPLPALLASPHKHRVVVHPGNPYTGEVEVRGSEAQHHHHLHEESEANLDDMRLRIN